MGREVILDLTRERLLGLLNELLKRAPMLPICPMNEPARVMRLREVWSDLQCTLDGFFGFGEFRGSGIVPPVQIIAH